MYKDNNIFIIHGAFSNPRENFFPWLKTELEKKDNSIFIPKFPTPKNQSLSSWLEVFKSYENNINENSIFIGHSLGVAFILKILEQLNTPIQSAYLICGFTEKLNIQKFDDINKTFIEKPFDFDKIKKNCKNFFVINSDSDPYVPIEKGKIIAKNLGTKLIILKNAGHINEEAGFVKFDFLLNLIKKTNLKKVEKALKWIVKILEANSIEYIITGGFSAHIYGSNRPINDIDIDIKEEDFEKIYKYIKKYIIFGPAQYIDEKWNLKLITLNYFGQEIDIGGANKTKIYDEKKMKWTLLKTDFKKARKIDIFKIVVNVIDPEDLIYYKTLLNGEHQKIDILAVHKYLTQT